MIQDRNRSLRSTALNAHGTTTSPVGSVRAQILTKPSCAGVAVSRSKLVEPGAATCVFIGMAGPCFKFQKLGTYVQGMYEYTITFSFLFWKKICRARPLANSRPTECVPCGPCP